LPLYEYQCTACGKRIEKIQKFSDAPLTKCRECGGKLERLLSASSFQLKGSGWYVTDYPKKSEPSSRASAESSSNGGDKKASKPAKKAESPATKPAKD
jgi:putative FmdB family regulatory protein